MRTQWVPYLINSGGSKEKIDMRGIILLDEEQAQQWLARGQAESHPELNGRRIDCFQEELVCDTCGGTKEITDTEGHKWPCYACRQI